MNIDLELYRVFFEVAKFQSITLAAKHLHISQPAISKSIKSLEEQIGGKLFIRSRNGVVLTEDGKVLFYYVKRALELFNQGEQKYLEMLNLKSGTVRVGISKTLFKEFLLPYIEKYHDLYPNIKIELFCSKASDLVKMLSDGLIDMVIANMPMDAPKDIYSYDLMTVHDVFVAKQDYNIDKEVIPLDELNNYNLILLPQGTNTRDNLDDILEQHDIVLDPYMTLASYSLVYEMTKVGFGIGFLIYEFCKDDIDSNILKVVNVDVTIPERKISLMLKKNFECSFATKKLIDLILD